MADVRKYGEQPKIPERRGGPEGVKKISSQLANSVNHTANTVKDLILFHEEANLDEKEFSLGPADETAASEVAGKNMLQWHPYRL